MKNLTAGSLIIYEPSIGETRVFGLVTRSRGSKCWVCWIDPLKERGPYSVDIEVWGVRFKMVV